MQQNPYQSPQIPSERWPAMSWKRLFVGSLVAASLSYLAAVVIARALLAGLLPSSRGRNIEFGCGCVLIVLFLASLIAALVSLRRWRLRARQEGNVFSSRWIVITFLLVISILYPSSIGPVFVLMGFNPLTDVLYAPVGWGIQTSEFVKDWFHWYMEFWYKPIQR